MNDSATREDLAAIKRANREFYRAFESLEIDRMMDCWANDEGLKCIHPGWPPLFAYDAIRESWERIFSGTDYIEFTLEEESAIVSGDLALVSCIEVLRTNNGGQESRGRLSATNGFRRYDDEWLMILHHAS